MKKSEKKKKEVKITRISAKSCDLVMTREEMEKLRKWIGLKTNGSVTFIFKERPEAGD